MNTPLKPNACICPRATDCVAPSIVCLHRTPHFRIPGCDESCRVKWRLSNAASACVSMPTPTQNLIPIDELIQLGEMMVEHAVGDGACPDCKWCGFTIRQRDFVTEHDDDCPARIIRAFVNFLKHLKEIPE